MDISELVIYLFFILFFLLGQYLKRRRKALSQAEISSAAVRSDNAGSSVYTSSATDVARQKSVYRSLEQAQVGPVSSKIQKLSSQNSDYRTQFKSHRSLQQAVVSTVVLGVCRADAPY